jgi:hypothetical protein
VLHRDVLTHWKCCVVFCGVNAPSSSFILIMFSAFTILVLFSASTLLTCASLFRSVGAGHDYIFQAISYAHSPSFMSFNSHKC